MAIGLAIAKVGEGHPSYNGPIPLSICRAVMRLRAGRGSSARCGPFQILMGFGRSVRLKFNSVIGPLACQPLS